MGGSECQVWIVKQFKIHSDSKGNTFYHIRSSSIASYYTRFRSLQDELNSSYGGPKCTYGAFSKFTEDQQLFQFLNGLNDSFSILKSSILMMSPLLSVNKVYSLLLQDKSQKENHSSITIFFGDSVACLTSSSPNTNRTYYQSNFSSKSNRSAYPQNNRGYSRRVNFDSKKPQLPSPASTASLFCTYCKKFWHAVENTIGSLFFLRFQVHKE